MENLSSLGIFLGGLGVLLLGCGLMWFISVWSKQQEKKQLGLRKGVISLVPQENDGVTSAR